MDWLDRPIRPGDRFVPLGPCRVSDSTHAWLFEPEGTAGGRYVRMPLNLAPDAGDLHVPEAVWKRYEWIIWEVDGPTYRLRIGADEPRGEPTGLVEAVDGSWTSQEAGG